MTGSRAKIRTRDSKKDLRRSGLARRPIDDVAPEDTKERVRSSQARPAGQPQADSRNQNRTARREQQDISEARVMSGKRSPKGRKVLSRVRVEAGEDVFGIKGSSCNQGGIEHGLGVKRRRQFWIGRTRYEDARDQPKRAGRVLVTQQFIVMMTSLIRQRKRDHNELTLNRQEIPQTLESTTHPNSDGFFMRIPKGDRRTERGGDLLFTRHRLSSRRACVISVHEFDPVLGIPRRKTSIGFSGGKC